MPCFHYEGPDGEPVPPNVEKAIVSPNLEILPSNAFYLKASLMQVELCEGLREIGSLAFCGCHSLTTVEIPASVTVIERVAFAECVSLTEIQLKEGLVTIGEGAFSSCSSLESVEIPASVERIDKGAFDTCESLVQVGLVEGGSLRHVGSDVFANCSSLRQMEIPASVESMGENVFSECTSLLEIQFNNRPLELERGFLFGCTCLQSLEIPDWTENIAFGALWNCGALVIVQLGQGLLQIDDYAFRNCVSLQTIAIPESLRMIGIRAFCSCIQLACVELPRRMNINLMDEAFCDCQSLVNIVIPSLLDDDNAGITTVAQDCFHQCTILLQTFGLDPESLADSLVHRFEGFPVHQLCYYASSTKVDELDQLGNEVDDLDDSVILDTFGMTPFHVLLSAAKSRTDLLQVLLSRCPSRWIGHEDNLGRRATDYIGSNWTKDSKSLLRMALEAWMLDWLSSSCELYISDIMSQIEEIVGEEDAEQRGRLLESAYHCFWRYQRIEASSLLEMALWKQVVLAYSDQEQQESDNESRGLLRVRCGAPIVIPNVMTYL